MKKRNRKSERGVAMIMALLALMVLSAIAVGLVYMTNTETSVNSNYRSEQVSYFAAKAGMEEARDRMMLNLPGGYYFANMAPNPLPVGIPAINNNQVLYILNEGNQPGTVHPELAGSPYMDDELCHEGYALGWNNPKPDPGAHCVETPAGTGWLTTTTSQLPYSGSSAALPFKWVRVTLKLNGSVQNYPVNNVSTPTTPAPPLTQPVCWNGTTEEVLPVGVASCAKLPQAATPVYILTALAVAPTPGTTTGARKLVQAEVALNPSSAFNYGLFGTGVGCGDVNFTGNGYTDSYNGSLGPYGPNNNNNSGGNVGSNGNVSLGGNGTIGGNVGVQPNGPNGTIVEGTCPGSNYTVSGGNAGLANNPANTLTPLLQPVQFPIPPTIVPPPPTNNMNMSKSTTLVPGNYGNISLSGSATLTLAPGVYNVNSLTMAGQASIVITPVGQVVLNVAGNGVNGNVLDLSGQSVDNQALNANDFQINYSGQGPIKVTGNASTSYFVLNAPQAPVTIAGNGNIMGAVIGNTIQVVGNGGFHYDTSIGLSPPSTGALQLISFRHIPY